ncbi:MAG TPA: dTMP kinase, partial [Sumerlaeia bacterium]|nr:dTMP kinase [Sumerlaeia bacterium]
RPGMKGRLPVVRRLKKGCLIAVEGIDGAGKTTQCERLARALRERGWDVVRLREPTEGSYGRRIRELAQSGLGNLSVREEFDLFLKDREENVRVNVRPALRRGAVVILDRYYYSSIAYQGARGLDPDFIRRENEKIAPPADLVILLTLPVEWVGRRIEGARNQARDLFETEDYLRRVKDLFDQMQDPQIVRIDATADEDAVFQGIQNALEPLLGKE